jgi:ATP-dependent DNA helicase RecG
MNRLLQGDVGSGKTVIAALAMAMVVNLGSQAAMMAPTSILAEQHYLSLQQLLAETGGVVESEQIRLLIGATSEADKRSIREGLANGNIKVVIGTHALIEDPVMFKDLELAIIDEQHRFGVEQRAALRQKGNEPHLMVMTATPIPRSLALTVYGDLDLLVMDELPPGRQEVDTHVFYPREHERAYTLIQNQVAQGYQAFIIYPLVEQGDKETLDDIILGGKAAVEEHRRLQADIFPQFQLGLLHGRLRPDEKDEVMTRFRDGQFQILVSTSVVEVGVDVPNATVMLIEGANRFGLSQLHQFRGRVGRGQVKSYCLLIPETEDAAENERLSAMVETTNGFVLAERDLEQRGPGDFLGTRQSGFTQQLKLSGLTDIQLIEKAQQAAREIFERDPELQLPENQAMAGVLQSFWGSNQRQGDVS